MFRTYLSLVERAERVALTYDPLLVGDLFFELIVIERHNVIEIVGLVLDALDMMRLDLNGVMGRSASVAIEINSKIKL